MTLMSSERQLKRRITTWRMDKNVKDEEMRAIIRVQKYRKSSLRKDSVFYVRDRFVDQRKIDRFAQRKNIPISSTPFEGRAQGFVVEYTLLADESQIHLIYLRT